MKYEWVVSYVKEAHIPPEMIFEWAADDNKELRLTKNKICILSEHKRTILLTPPH